MGVLQQYKRPARSNANDTNTVIERLANARSQGEAVTRSTAGRTGSTCNGSKTPDVVPKVACATKVANIPHDHQVSPMNSELGQSKEVELSTSDSVVKDSHEISYSKAPDVVPTDKVIPPMVSEPCPSTDVSDSVVKDSHEISHNSEPGQLEEVKLSDSDSVVKDSHDIPYNDELDRKLKKPDAYFSKEPTEESKSVNPDDVSIELAEIRDDVKSVLEIVNGYGGLFPLMVHYVDTEETSDLSAQTLQRVLEVYKREKLQKFQEAMSELRNWQKYSVRQATKRNKSSS